MRTSNCTGTLSIALLRMVKNFTDAHCVGRLESRETICGSMLKTFISMGRSFIIANIAVRLLLAVTS